MGVEGQLKRSGLLGMEVGPGEHRKESTTESQNLMIKFVGKPATGDWQNP